jgi:predicted RNase H-like HicB family nuclease
MTAYKYRIILGWSERDQRWLAQVPELLGCMADGFTPEEALANAEVIIGEWIEVAQIEGRPIPQPQPLEPSATSV